MFLFFGDKLNSIICVVPILLFSCNLDGCSTINLKDTVAVQVYYSQNMKCIVIIRNKVKWNPVNPVTNGP